MRKKYTCILFSPLLLWVFCYLQSKVFPIDIHVQMFFLLCKDHCAWNSPHPFALSLPFLATSTDTQVEAGVQMKLNFETSGVWVSFQALVSSFLPALVCFQFAIESFSTPAKLLHPVGSWVSIKLSFPAKSLLLATNLS